jgi:hypothetical protein
MGLPLGFRTKLRSLAAVQEHFNSLYMNHILTSTYAFYNLAHHAEIFLILPEFDGSISMFDVDKIPEIAERGKQAAQAQIPHLKRLLERGATAG